MSVLLQETRKVDKITGSVERKPTKFSSVPIKMKTTPANYKYRWGTFKGE